MAYGLWLMTLRDESGKLSSRALMMEAAINNNARDLSY